MNELIQQLNTAGIRYLLIGGQAMRLAGMPRYSMDWDFFIPRGGNTAGHGRHQVYAAEIGNEPMPDHAEAQEYRSVESQIEVEAWIHRCDRPLRA